MTHKELEKLYDSTMRKKQAKDRAEERQYAFKADDVLKVKNGLVLLKGGKYESKN